jgi:hypothetical protein
VSFTLLGAWPVRCNFVRFIRSSTAAEKYLGESSVKMILKSATSLLEGVVLDVVPEVVVGLRARMDG